DSGSFAIEEQAALIEAFGWAYVRSRLPRLLDEYEPVAIEHEELTLLSGDVALAGGGDGLVRRRRAGYLFLFKLQTSSAPGSKQWADQWLTDQQLMTETLAVERRLGERVWGVLIDGFNKGRRVECYADTLKEIRDGGERRDSEGNFIPHVYCQQSRL